MERPACWIKGNMGPADYENDEVRLLTHLCPHRKPTGWSLFGPTNECYHQGAMSEYQNVQSDENVIMVGGVDGFATFCPAVDLHLTSIGESSRLYLDGDFTVVENPEVITEDHLLLPPKE